MDIDIARAELHPPRPRGFGIVFTEDELRRFGPLIDATLLVLCAIEITLLALENGPALFGGWAPYVVVGLQLGVYLLLWVFV
ncbi:hypothetical protein FN846DRAFT_960118 [Sphaerosporella brunnea]|uniref:Uncharacterized protein n=1 Tax=Sphaerosporella brunnea TaxID=1250544 RepID=A0A5J5ERM9_9PEZI|nr:hypothetical protein FN846DRAFT_960118 [Sphaerosporella brunnea]